MAFNQNRSPNNERNRTQSSRNDDEQRQMSEMRSKITKRLIGIILLVIVAVIVLPLIFKSNDEPTEPEQAPLVSPAGSNNQGQSLSVETAPGVQAEGEAATGTLAPQEGTEQADTHDGTTTPDTEGHPDNQDQSATDPTSVAQSTNPDLLPETSSESNSQDSTQNNTSSSDSVAQSTADTNKATSPSKDSAQNKTPSKPSQKSDTSKNKKSNHTIADKDRTDDGSKALALLQGKSVSKATPSQSNKTVTSGSYNVQVGSFTSAADARAQRDKLRSKGVSDAYVQVAQVSGKPVYRLRIGPFSSKESAQATQTRVRALNFPDSFVTGN
ncbi:SPOR domain-containing protein [Brackiella oedipodis]|uniref:SPOR domain-containing protein n=1 Tax=Brackiella oedipodis TaxID=124225 RepID=UPI00048AE240|nr:SPOR domain-containing protein [Brackiella oedipodis]